MKAYPKFQKVISKRVCSLFGTYINYLKSTDKHFGLSLDSLKSAITTDLRLGIYLKRFSPLTTYQSSVDLTLISVFEFTLFYRILGASLKFILTYLKVEENVLTIYFCKGYRTYLACSYIPCKIRQHLLLLF